jgi:hypothetical protein
MENHPRPKINTFAELFDHITYDWGFDKRNLVREADGNFWVNKTYITPTELSYKTERYEITNEAVFQKLEKFYELLQTTETEKILFQQDEN